MAMGCTKIPAYAPNPSAHQIWHSDRYPVDHLAEVVARPVHKCTMWHWDRYTVDQFAQRQRVNTATCQVP
eukprot:6847934-Alexandrium_andersonii.AAC.1